MILKKHEIWNNFKKIIQKSSNVEVKRASTKFCDYFESFYIPKIEQWIIKTDENG